MLHEWERTKAPHVPYCARTVNERPSELYDYLMTYAIWQRRDQSTLATLLSCARAWAQADDSKRRAMAADNLKNTKVDYVPWPITECRIRSTEWYSEEITYAVTRAMTITPQERELYASQKLVESEEFQTVSNFGLKSNLSAAAPDVQEIQALLL